MKNIHHSMLIDIPERINNNNFVVIRRGVVNKSTTSNKFQHVGIWIWWQLMMLSVTTSLLNASQSLVKAPQTVVVELVILIS